MSYPEASKRLNKAISDSGYCSRRKADELIEQGVVTLNDQPMRLGDRVMPGDVIKINGEVIGGPKSDVYLMLNKPVGITCTTDQRVKGNVVDFINFSERIFHVGRLDKPSEGLLLMTNDGDIVNKILRAGNRHEKEYIVRVDRPISAEFIQRMSRGIPILDTVTKPCEVQRVSRFVFKIILVQGLNRQIRRMCEYLNYEVVALKRVRIMTLTLGDLPTGQWRHLTREEVAKLQESLTDSDNTPYSSSDLDQGFN
ncbi:MAG TPA: 23S rRNA pseudouridine(2604) synthase RluF [Flavobacteriaceae bacterium]|nr:23S rRNA pseudouridine(2604) synthase RluF [Flavobacteriaceae bacterium]